MSDIRANTISDAAGTGPINLHKQSAAKAYGNWSQSPNHVIQSSFNFSSVTDTGAGNATLTLISSMNGAVFTVVGTNGNSTIDPSDGTLAASPASSSTFLTEVYSSTAHALLDRVFNMAVVNGDLA